MLWQSGSKNGVMRGVTALEKPHVTRRNLIPDDDNHSERRLGYATMVPKCSLEIALQVHRCQ